MSMISGWGASVRGLFADKKGPWGPAGSDDDGGEPPRSPWGGAPGSGRPSPDQPLGNRTTLDDFLRKSRARFGGGGGGVPRRPDASTVVWGLIALAAVWLVFTSMHSIAPEQRGVVSRFGRYVYTLGPGIGLTLPSPIERVKKIDVENIRTVDLGSASTEDPMLTGDQNVIDIAYSVRWNIRDPELFLFEIARPEETIRQVAESAMRAVISSVTLDDAIGDKRSEIETRVAENMQRILNAYSSGVLIQGVAIKQADPPQAVNDAFKDVSAAQQDAQRYVNAANAYAQQLTAKAQGEATAFDKVYDQYRLAPEVTRRRMYYETMERVLARVDKTIIQAPGVVPYLPLPQAGKAATTPPAAQQGPGQ
jgi:membrane protease subunit HflK